MNNILLDGMVKTINYTNNYLKNQNITFCVTYSKKHII